MFHDIFRLHGSEGIPTHSSPQTKQQDTSQIDFLDTHELGQEEERDYRDIDIFGRFAVRQLAAARKGVSRPQRPGQRDKHDNDHVDGRTTARKQIAPPKGVSDLQELGQNEGCNNNEDVCSYHIGSFFLGFYLMLFISFFTFFVFCCAEDVGITRSRTASFLLGTVFGFFVQGGIVLYFLVG